MLWGKCLKRLDQSFPAQGSDLYNREGVSPGRVKQRFLNKLFEVPTHPTTWNEMSRDEIGLTQIWVNVSKWIATWLHRFKTFETFKKKHTVSILGYQEWQTIALEVYAIRLSEKEMFACNNCRKYIPTIFVFAWNTAIIFLEECSPFPSITNRAHKQHSTGIYKI